MENKPLDILGQEIRIGDIIAYASGSSRGHLKYGYVLLIHSENRPYPRTWPTCDGTMIDRWRHAIFQFGCDFRRKHWRDEQEQFVITAPRWVPVQSHKVIIIHPYQYTNEIAELIKYAQDNYNEQGKKITAGK